MRGKKFKSIFYRNSAREKDCRRHHRLRRAHFEQLEPRVLLAITGVPSVGDQSGVPITLSADSADPTNQLTITLSEQIKSGSSYVVANIDIGDGTGPVDYWNFGDSITFTGTDDPLGNVENSIDLTTSYEVELAQGLNTTTWEPTCLFSAGVSLLNDVGIMLNKADKLSVTAGNLGGIISTIGGTFTSPTLDPDVSNGSNITLFSYIPIQSQTGIPIGCYTLSLQSNGEIVLDEDVATVGDISLSSKKGPSQLVLGAGLTSRSVTSSSGSILLNNAAGQITLSKVSIEAVKGSITASTPNKLTLANTSLTAAPIFALSAPTVGLISLQGDTGLSIPTTTLLSAGRLELSTTATEPILLTNVAVSSLKAWSGGDLTIINSKSLQISDLDPAVPTIAVQGANVGITAAAGLRVVDGITATGTLSLEASGAVAFVTTATGDGSGFTGSLRNMLNLLNANATVGQSMSLVFDEILSPLSLAGTITLTSALPSITKAITFDGTLSTIVDSSSIIGIDGNSVATNGLTLALGSSKSTIRDAAFYGFTGAGIRLESAENLLAGLSLGTNRKGETLGVIGNNIGVDLYGKNAIRNTIGVKTVGSDAGNVIVSSQQAGLLIRSNANYNAIYGNKIGVDALGLAAPNAGDGIVINACVGTVVGGAQAALQNNVSNNQNGIRIKNVTGQSPAYGAQITGNIINLNTTAGISMEGGSYNIIGGLAAGLGNTFAGNADGIRLMSFGSVPTHHNQIVANTIDTSSVNGVLIDQGYANTIQGNTVSDGVGSGIHLYRAVASRLQLANKIIGNTVSGNGDSAINGGVLVEKSSGQLVGGATASLGNTVISNGGSGIVIVGGTGNSSSTLNTVQGNYIGTNSVGDDQGNAFDGIRIQGGTMNTIVGNTVRFNKTVLNASAGIAVQDTTATSAATGNSIVSNTVADNYTGVRIAGGVGSKVGGSLASQGNFIFRNASHGLRIESSPSTGAALKTMVRNNHIGVDTGDVAAGNTGFGIDIAASNETVVDCNNILANNSSGGLRVQGGRVTTIGSYLEGKGNTISSNGNDGIFIVEPINLAQRTELVFIVGNQINTNGGFGIEVLGARAVGVTIGRNAPSNSPNTSGNVIRGNGSGGVLVDAAKGVTIIGNQITGNTGLQIEQITNANGGITAPLITSATPREIGQAAPQYAVRGTINRIAGSTGPQSMWVDLYGSNTTTGQQFYLGRILVAIRTGVAAMSFRVITKSAGGTFDQILATATSTVGLGTSEFGTPLSI